MVNIPCNVVFNYTAFHNGPRLHKLLTILNSYTVLRFGKGKLPDLKQSRVKGSN